MNIAPYIVKRNYIINESSCVTGGKAIKLKVVARYTSSHFHHCGLTILEQENPESLGMRGLRRADRAQGTMIEASHFTLSRATSVRKLATHSWSEKRLRVSAS